MMPRCCSRRRIRDSKFVEPILSQWLYYVFLHLNALLLSRRGEVGRNAVVVSFPWNESRLLLLLLLLLLPLELFFIIFSSTSITSHTPFYLFLSFSFSNKYLSFTFFLSVSYSLSDVPLIFFIEIFFYF